LTRPPHGRNFIPAITPDVVVYRVDNAKSGVGGLWNVG
jgi:hypothetical protein